MANRFEIQRFEEAFIRHMFTNQWAPGSVPDTAICSQRP